MIAIQIASNTEWKALCTILDAQELHTTPYGPYFDTSIRERSCRIYYSGYSKVKAAGAVQYAISNWSPDQIFVCGTCGGVSSKLKPEDIVIATETVFYDCIDRFTENDAPFFPYLDTVLEHRSPLSIEGRRIHYGRVASGDQDIDTDIRNMLEPLDVLVADWESAAVAHVCALNKTPLVVIRGVSDIPGYEGASIEDQAQSYLLCTPKIMRTIFHEILPHFIAQTPTVK